MHKTLLLNHLAFYRLNLRFKDEIIWIQYVKASMFVTV